MSSFVTGSCSIFPFHVVASSALAICLRLGCCLCKCRLAHPLEKKLIVENGLQIIDHTSKSSQLGAIGDSYWYCIIHCIRSVVKQVVPEYQSGSDNLLFHHVGWVM